MLLGPSYPNSSPSFSILSFYSLPITCSSYTRQLQSSTHCNIPCHQAFVSVLPLVWNTLFSLVFLTKVWSFCKFKEAFSRSLYNYIYITFKLWCYRRLLRFPWTARKSNQSILKEINWIFTGRTGAAAETPVLWPPDVKRRLTRKDPDAGKDWRREEKRATEDGMVG